jgi:hypothetical protein
VRVQGHDGRLPGRRWIRERGRIFGRWKQGVELASQMVEHCERQQLEQCGLVPERSWGWSAAMPLGRQRRDP